MLYMEMHHDMIYDIWYIHLVSQWSVLSDLVLFYTLVLQLLYRTQDSYIKHMVRTL